MLLLIHLELAELAIKLTLELRNYVRDLTVNVLPASLLVRPVSRYVPVTDGLLSTLHKTKVRTRTGLLTERHHLLECHSLTGLSLLNTQRLAHSHLLERRS
jgi:hypothetical protein